jgi:alpha-tubulin suppressor-like RCC1 family protein
VLGKNGDGRLGEGTMTNRSLPVNIDAGIGYAQIMAGDFHRCGITTTGTLKCWGSNLHGQLGDWGSGPWLPRPALGMTAP